MLAGEMLISCGKLAHLVKFWSYLIDTYQQANSMLVEGVKELIHLGSPVTCNRLIAFPVHTYEGPYSYSCEVGFWGRQVLSGSLYSPFVNIAKHARKCSNFHNKPSALRCLVSN